MGQSQEEAIRELQEKRNQAFRERMEAEQRLRVEVARKNPQVAGVQPPDVERCPHGIPLARSCRICDVATEKDIKDRIPIQ
jgi:hypothetical protein